MQQTRVMGNRSQVQYPTRKRYHHRSHVNISIFRKNRRHLVYMESLPLGMGESYQSTRYYDVVSLLGRITQDAIEHIRNVLDNLIRQMKRLPVATTVSKELFADPSFQAIQKRVKH